MSLIGSQPYLSALSTTKTVQGKCLPLHPNVEFLGNCQEAQSYTQSGNPLLPKIININIHKYPTIAIPWKVFFLMPAKESLQYLPLDIGQGVPSYGHHETPVLIPRISYPLTSITQFLVERESCYSLISSKPLLILSLASLKEYWDLPKLSISLFTESSEAVDTMTTLSTGKTD